MQSIKALVFICLISIFPLRAFSQEVILDEEPGSLYEEKDGPDSKFYNHIYFAAGLFSNHDQKSGAEIKMPNSFEMLFGTRYKLRLLSFYALGFDVSYRYQKYCINQKSNIPDALNPFTANPDAKKQVMGINSLGLEIYNRFKAGKGNNLGYYIDAGIRGEWNYAPRRMVFNEYKTEVYPAARVKQTETRLDYINKTSLTATGRIGFKKNILYGNYRITDIISEGYSSPELPRMSIGLQRAF